MHEFGSLAMVTAFLEKHAASHGFEVRQKTTGSVTSERHGATYFCWCRHSPPSPIKEEVIHSVKPARVRHAVSSLRGGKMVKCGCTWSISVYRWSSGDYRFGHRNLIHTGHNVLPPTALTTTLDSLRNVSPLLEDEVRRMLTHGIRCSENERRYLQAGHGIEIDKELYRNLIKKLKRDLGFKDAAEDFRGLLDWLQSEMHGNGVTPVFTSVQRLPVAIPARNARYGQIWGYCQTISTIAADYTEIFHTALQHMEKTAAWLEKITASARVPPRILPPPTSAAAVSSSVGSSSASSSALALHASVPVEQVTFPQHKRRSKGRPGEKRVVGEGERASKRPSLTSSQVM